MQLLNRQNNNQDAYPQSSLLNRDQKLAVAFLFIFTLGVVGYGAYQFKTNLVSAIDYSKGRPLTILDEEVIASSTDAYLKKQDTDKDGLNDWDELNIYETSPYLEDTDGDGIKDSEEVKKGTNPKCQEGKDCSQSNFLSDATATSSGIVSDTVTNGLSQEQLKQLEQVNQLIQLRDQAGTSSAALKAYTGAGADVTTDAGQTQSTILSGTKTADANSQQILNGQADVTTLRQALLKAGMDPASLSKISDEILLQSYGDVLKKK